MNEHLIVIDVQRDFVDGSLGLSKLRQSSPDLCEGFKDKSEKALKLETLTRKIENQRKEINTAFMIAGGLELLSSYLKGIATLAIKRNDAELLELCKGLLIVKEDG